MKARYWSLAIVLILINYLIFATLFTRLVETDFTRSHPTRIPEPTFTPAPAEPIIIVPTPVPVTPEPTPTATRVMGGSDAGPGNAPPGEDVQASSPPPASQQAGQPQLVAPGPVNIRSGPGIDFEVIGTLNANTVMPIIGRNLDSSWWQIKIADGITGWISGAVVNASNTGSVPLADSPSLKSSASVDVQPAADNSPPPATPQPKFQFEPAGWWGDTNHGLTRFLGDIKDANGNPVNGVSVQASCGDYSIISNPSGDQSSAWPPGFYDIVVDAKPVPCLWVLTVVETDDGQTVKATLSESIPVQVTYDESIIVANWRKNW